MKVLKFLIFITVILSIIYPVGAYLCIIPILMLLLYMDKFERIIKTKNQSKSILLILTSLFLSTIFSSDIAFSICFNLILFLNLLLGSTIYRFLDYNDLKNMYKVMSYTCFVVCVFSIYQFVTGDVLKISSWVDYTSYGSITRVYSTFQNPNIFAGYTVLNLCFFITYYLFQQKNRTILTKVIIVLLSISLVLTYSRGAFISLCILIIFIFTLKKDKRLLRYLTFMLVFFYVFNTFSSMNRASIVSISTDSSSIYRIEIWKSAISIFLKSPLYGNGVGTLWYYLSLESDKLYKYVFHAHNIYLHIIGEAGIIGLFTFFYVVKIEIVKVLCTWKSNKHNQLGGVALGLIGTIVVTLVHGMFDGLVFIPSYSLIFVIYFSMYKALCYNCKFNNLKVMV